MRFKQGQSVVCIKPGKNLGLVRDGVYTVIEETTDASGNSAVMLLELDPPEPYYNYLAWRFAEVKPSKVKDRVEEIEAT